MVERISDEKLREAFRADLEQNRKVDQHWLDFVQAIILGGGIGGSLLSFYAAALSWRSYELASTTGSLQILDTLEAESGPRD